MPSLSGAVLFASTIWAYALSPSLPANLIFGTFRAMLCGSL
jgi:hypothetical protein